MRFASLLPPNRQDAVAATARSISPAVSARSKRLSSSSIDSERVERIAMLIRQHKELHFDKSTGVSSIPARSFSAGSPSVLTPTTSYFQPQIPDASARTSDAASGAAAAGTDAESSSPAGTAVPLSAGPGGSVAGAAAGTSISSQFTHGPHTAAPASPATSFVASDVSPASVVAAAASPSQPPLPPPLPPKATALPPLMLSQVPEAPEPPSPKAPLGPGSGAGSARSASLDASTSTSIASGATTANSQLLHAHPARRQSSGDMSATLVPTQSSSNQISTSTLPQTEPLKSYKERDPVEVGRMLFDGTLPGYRQESVSLIIGRGDEYHNVVLISYMDSYDFSQVRLDEAFRRLCKKLYLAGETQMVDRILYQFSRRYWDCNPPMQSMYRSIDIVYGILFSIVLLNTDLHIVNFGQNQSKRMTRKTFLKNTMELVDTMIEKDEKIKEEVALNSESIKKWKRELETILKDLYSSVLTNRIIQTSVAPASMDAPPLAEEPAEPRTGSPRLTREGSSWSLSSIQSTGSVFHAHEKERSVSTASAGFFRKRQPDKNTLMGFFRAATEGAASFSTSVGLFDAPTNVSNENLPDSGVRVIGARASDSIVEGLLIRKHVLEKGELRAKSRRWNKVWCVLRPHHERGVELVMYKTVGTRDNDGFEEHELSACAAHDDAHSTPSASSLPTPPVVLSEAPGASEQAPATPPLDRRTSRHRAETLPSSFGALSLGTPAGNATRRSNSTSSGSPDRQPSSDPGLPPHPPHAQHAQSSMAHSAVGYAPMAFSSSSASASSASSASPAYGSQPHASAAERTIKLSAQEPEVASLLHAYCSALQIAYSVTRPHVLSLKLANGNEYLLQAPTASLLAEWVRGINYWAARKSKEPIRGSVSSMEYGWTWITWERKAREAEDPSLAADEKLGPLHYFQTLLSRGASLDAPSRLSNASNESGPGLVSSSASVRSVPVTGSDMMASPSSSGAAQAVAQASVMTMPRTPKQQKSRPKPKVVDWNAPTGFGQIVSQLSEEAQLAVMLRQVDIVKGEILEHLSFKDPMEKYFADSPSAHSKACANWNRRLRFLEHELQKFSTYVRALSDSPLIQAPVAILQGGTSALSESPTRSVGDETPTPSAGQGITAQAHEATSVAPDGAAAGGGDSGLLGVQAARGAFDVSASLSSSGGFIRSLNIITEDDQHTGATDEADAAVPE
ncbi:hypothetical protein HK105_201776 [Polyrhizophydium stewartii]|uniref:SEC7 domain-containing protein n=1 Tax=Polyrhizophydium stewartii TaxID=2732419 RepID=A0ABR4NFZ4_9FUNG